MTLPDHFEAAVALILLAGAVKGALGIGQPMVFIGLFSQFADPRLAMSLVVIPMLFSNVWQVFRAGRALETMRRYLVFALCLVTCLFVATQFAARAPSETVLLALGGVICLFSLMNLTFTPPPLPARGDRIWQGLFGGVAGVMGGVTAIWSPPMVAYLIGRGVEKDEFIRATGFLILAGAAPLCLGYWNAGLLTGPVAGASALLVAPTLLGFAFGEALRRRLPTELFRKIVIWAFLLMGLNLIRRALMG